MSAIDEKIQATKFIRHTTKSFDQVRSLGLEAAAAASGNLTKILESNVDTGDLVQYTVKRVGIFEVLSFGLIFMTAADGSTNTVLLQPGPYVTSQPTLLFIPIGPKDAAGYPPLKKFSEHMQALLS